MARNLFQPSLFNPFMLRADLAPKTTGMPVASANAKRLGRARKGA
jgi:hypothetical protein